MVVRLSQVRFLVVVFYFTFDAKSYKFQSIYGLETSELGEGNFMDFGIVWGCPILTTIRIQAKSKVFHF